MDEKFLEQADALTASLTEAGIARARTKRIKPTDFEGFCTCGTEVPQLRVDLSLYNCVDCQTALERRTKMGQRG
jgi:RNA polymerase-binding transcription factor DksA